MFCCRARNATARNRENVEPHQQVNTVNVLWLLIFQHSYRNCLNKSSRRMIFSTVVVYLRCLFELVGKVLSSLEI